MITDAGARVGIKSPAKTNDIRAAISLPEALAEPLRRGEPAVVGRLEGGRLLLDLRSVAPPDDPRLVGAVLTAGGRAVS